ncbi:hypothetical protein BASA81_012273 [Batrachochytrium salamandrivorans]|nr:hypothetical protein BASA81_012273 [Batrachochytrium salamandrivorans]
MHDTSKDALYQWAQRESRLQRLQWYPLRGTDAETKRCLVSNFFRLLGATFDIPQLSSSALFTDPFLNDELANPVHLLRYLLYTCYC